MLIRLSNDFHGTQADIHADYGDTLNARRVRRVRATLCGMVDCKCAENCLGTRGWQSVVIQDRGDGTATIWRHRDDE